MVPKWGPAKWLFLMSKLRSCLPVFKCPFIKIYVNCRQNLRAVKEGRVVAVDGSQHFNRPGPRLVDALEWLTGLLNDKPDMIPEDFPWKWL